jgi:hypothetical protein
VCAGTCGATRGTHHPRACVCVCGWVGVNASSQHLVNVDVSAAARTFSLQRRRSGPRDVLSTGSRAIGQGSPVADTCRVCRVVKFTRSSAQLISLHSTEGCFTLMWLGWSATLARVQVKRAVFSGVKHPLGGGCSKDSLRPRARGQDPFPDKILKSSH